MKRQGDEEEGSRKRPKGAVEVSEGKLFQLWGKGYTKEERAAMQLDETAVYSVTDARTADRITTHMLALEGAPFRLVADGCGCVGGNSLSFGRALAKQGGRVMAIELDPIRFAMLENNVRVSGLVETVTCVCGDSAQLVLDPTAPRDAGAQRAWTALRSLSRSAVGREAS
ncbi:hypothetical protein CTAYLR_004815 [Chrysophaeum taylorii]|uniref:Trimethylguanosine synthase n=1 Tax=Chrysophaeum taylorii TaxID=2483200 RepID=A0AAD7UQ23_9STRA|nr:hypothetical protein CTAYLR_004815 [Chrysophaeum taylorii]